MKLHFDQVLMLFSMYKNVSMYTKIYICDISDFPCTGEYSIKLLKISLIFYPCLCAQTGLNYGKPGPSPAVLVCKHLTQSHLFAQTFIHQDNWRKYIKV